MSGLALGDIGIGLRKLIRAPGFTAVAVVTLALGIGANTAIFTLVDAVFGRSGAVRDPAQLVNLYTTDRRNALASYSMFPMSYMNYKDVRAQNNVFSDI
ncbi:MAG TPA: multidrug ABC transporter substrate-binding protein, partial [Bryobacteraceae bacterium]